MLPKIPYSMEKNKSLTIPIGNFNISSNYSPGDIAASYGVSARKFPHLTTRKSREKVYEGGAILAITVFNGEIVTVRMHEGQIALFVGDTQIEGAFGTSEYGSSYRNRNFATINTKLVIYPDKIYIEKTGDSWSVGALEAQLHGDVEFGSGGLIVTGGMNTQELIGYGAAVLNNAFTGYVRSKSKLEGKYLFFGDGTIVPVKKYGTGTAAYKENDSVEIKGLVEGKFEDKYKMFYVIGNHAFRCDADTIHEYDKNVTNIGGDTYYTEFTLTTKCVGDVAEFTGNHSCDLYFLDEDNQTPFRDIKKDRYVTISHNGDEVISGNVKGVSDYYSKLKLDNPYMSFEGCVLEGEFWIHYYGWDIDFLEKDDLIVFEAYPAIFLRVTDKSIDGDEFTISLETAAKLSINYDLKTSITLTRYRQTEDMTSMFKVGDTVTISGSEVTAKVEGEEGEETEIVSNDTSFVITNIKGNIISAEADIFTAGPCVSPITIERKVPDLDFICERDNRLYGVNNSEKTVYVSALGDPTNMYAYEGVATDSFAVAVGGEGDFTGCCKYGESVLFFKEDKIYKLTGYTPADFAIDSYDVDGLEAGAERSIVVINEVLYYKGKSGIFAYNGGIPTLISGNFGDDIDLFFDAVAGTDGVNYYIALNNDDFTYLFCYNTRLGLWVLEDKIADGICGFARKSNILYMAIDDGNVYQMNVTDSAFDLEWMVQFVPFYETIEGKKTYSRLLMRVEIPYRSYVIIEVRSDDGPWCEAGKIVGTCTGMIPVRLPIARCDKFEIRLRGKGEFTIHDLIREYHVGSEV